MNLTVGDGFKFGCGVLLAGAFGLGVVLLLLAIVALIANVFYGASIPIAPAP